MPPLGRTTKEENYSPFQGGAGGCPVVKMALETRRTPPYAPLDRGDFGRVRTVPFARGRISGRVGDTAFDAVDLDFCSQEEAKQALAQIEELQRMLNSLRQKRATRH